MRKNLEGCDNMLRKFFSSILVLLMMFTLTSIDNHASAANTQEVQMLNRTGRIIQCLWAKRSSGNEWSKCLIGPNNILKSGSYKNILVDPECRYYDIQIMFAGGQKLNYTKCDFSGAWRISFVPNGAGSYVVWKN